ncbi:hypothetical protein CTRI78_v003888 [Colletotrichum trifolii]|uniref:Uncharacterized protein n=1 Tax=Colletotrichum trifolii TaxID=5466 RepID=A0A4V3HWM5_COLTR|nr:hypothetical protein CTRI78_v003888 [Colletotrichum trifolii]
MRNLRDEGIVRCHRQQMLVKAIIIPLGQAPLLLKSDVESTVLAKIRNTHDPVSMASVLRMVTWEVPLEILLVSMGGVGRTLARNCECAACVPWRC